MADSLTIPPFVRPARLPAPHRFRTKPPSGVVASRVKPKQTIAHKAIAMTAQFYLNLLPRPRVQPPALKPAPYETLQIEQAPPPTMLGGAMGVGGIHRAELEPLLEQAQLREHGRQQLPSKAAPAHEGEWPLAEGDWQRAVEPHRRVALLLATLVAAVLAAAVGAGATLLIRGEPATVVQSTVVQSRAVASRAARPVPAGQPTIGVLSTIDDNDAKPVALHPVVVERLGTPKVTPKAKPKRRRARRRAWPRVPRVDVAGILAGARGKPRAAAANVDDILAAGAQ